VAQDAAADEYENGPDDGVERLNIPTADTAVMKKRVRSMPI